MSVEAILRVLQAFAFGDAAGMPTQLLSRSRATAEIVQNGLFFDAPKDNPICPGQKGGSITDDTFQLIILTDNLIAGNGVFELKSFAAQMLSWEQQMIASGSEDLLGPSTKKALAQVASSKQVESVMLAGTTNGAAMRIPALAMAYPIKTRADLEPLLSQIIEINRTSHNSPEAGLGCAAVATMISAGLQGENFDAAIDLALEASKLMMSHFPNSSAANYILRLPKIFDDISRLGKSAKENSVLEYIDAEIGTSMESSESILAAFATAWSSAPSPISAATNAAKLGGDSDTIAALAASMLAAFGGWGEAEQHASELITRVNEVDFQTRAVGLWNLRNNQKHVR